MIFIVLFVLMRKDNHLRVKLLKLSKNIEQNPSESDLRGFYFC